MTRISTIVLVWSLVTLLTISVGATVTVAPPRKRSRRLQQFMAVPPPPRLRPRTSLSSPGSFSSQSSSGNPRYVTTSEFSDTRAQADSASHRMAEAGLSLESRESSFTLGDTSIVEEFVPQSIYLQHEHQAPHVAANFAALTPPVSPDEEGPGGGARGEWGHGVSVEAGAAEAEVAHEFVVPQPYLRGGGDRGGSAHAAESGNSSPSGSGRCDERDVFTGPVESFVPPKRAPLAEVYRWEDSVKETLDRLSKLQYGGERLRDTVKKEARTLQILRHEMFCKYA